MTWFRHAHHLEHASGAMTVARTGPPGRYVYSVWVRVTGGGDNGRGWRCIGHYATANAAKAAADERASA